MRQRLLAFSMFLLFTNQSFADERDDEILGANSAAQSATVEEVDDNTSSLGGRLSLDSAASLFGDKTISNTVYNYGLKLYTYIDAQPNDTTRAFARARVLHPDPTQTTTQSNQAGPRIDLDEGWVKVLPFQKRLFVTIGRQHVKWGTGRFWNPSDILAPSALDPFAVYDYRLGSDLLKIHYPMEKEGTNLYAIVDMSNLVLYPKPGGAMRAEFTGKDSEYSFTVYGREKKPGKLAGDISMGLGPLDIHSEVVYSFLNNDIFYDEQALLNPTNPQTYSRRYEWIPQGLVGIHYDHQYSEEKHFFIEVEYFYNGIGYENKDLEFLALGKRAASPLYAGRNYLGALFGLPYPGSFTKTSFYLSSLMNLSDQSAFARFSSQTVIYKELLIELWATYAYGKTGEFRYTPPVATQNTTNQSLASLSDAAGLSKAVGISIALSF